MVIPDQYVEQFDPANLNNVEIPVISLPDPAALAPAPSPAPGAEGEGEQFHEEAEVIEESNWEDPASDALDSLENFGETNAEELAEWITDILISLKDGISLMFAAELERELRGTFQEKDKEIIPVVEFLDQEGRLNFETLKEISEKYSYPFQRLLEVKVAYTKIKKRWETQELKQRQQEGIRRNSRKVAVKYFNGKEIDPLILLGGYILIALGGDVARIWANKLRKT